MYQKPSHEPLLLLHLLSSERIKAHWV